MTIYRSTFLKFIRHILYVFNVDAIKYLSIFLYHIFVALKNTSRKVQEMVFRIN